MTVNANDRRKEYEGNGIATEFNGPYLFLASQLTVSLVEAGVSTVVPTNLYQVQNIGRTGGTRVIMNTAPTVDQDLVLLRTVAFNQPTDITNQGAFLPETLEKGLDYIVMQTQQNEDGVSRSVRLGDSVVGSISLTLPQPTPLGVWVWNATGDAIEYGDPSISGDLLLRGELASTGTDKGTELVYTKQAGTGAVARTQADKNAEQVSVLDFGAIGNGVADDTLAFTNATALGVPVFVPYTSQFYSLSALSNASLELLWGPGLVKVASAVTQIASAPTFGSDDLAGLNVVKPNMTPAQFPGVAGSIGNGAASWDATRTGGFASYGNVLNRYHVEAATPAGHFDVGLTTWVTHENLTGGQVFAGWFGANSPAANLGEAFSGAAVGVEINVGNRWGNLGLQTDVGGTRYTTGIQLAPDVLPAKDGLNTIAVSSISIASPGVVTLNSHGFIADMGIVFDGAGTLPTGLTKGVCYFVSQTGLTANTFQVAATVGGASINTTGSFAAPITVLPSWAGSFGMVTGASVWGHRWWVGELTRYDTIVAGGYHRLDHGGSGAGSAPGSWSKLVGFYGRGLDMRGVVFANHAIDLANAGYTSGAAINFDFTASYSGTATPGGVVSPGNFQGYLKLAMNGGFIKVPFFQN